MNCQLFKSQNQQGQVSARLHIEKAPCQKPSLEIPFEDWPNVFKHMVKEAIPEDKGIGDIVERKFGQIGARFKIWFKKVTGKACGCEYRKNILNEKYPLRLIKHNKDNGMVSTV